MERTWKREEDKSIRLGGGLAWIEFHRKRISSSTADNIKAERREGSPRERIEKREKLGRKITL